VAGGGRQKRGLAMKYLHTMLRVRNLDQALDFYCNKLGLKEVRRRESEQGRFTLVFLAAPADEGLVEQSKRAISATSPMRSMIFMRCASA
jgi:catechol 2,3-dioxygenase-like lactoylglutathione lyase family enzyme